MSTSSSDSDDNFLRLHARAIAQALQQQEVAEQALAGGASSTAAATKSQRDQLVQKTYSALCHDDPRVESDFACQCLATALLDPQSPYALSGPLVEGIRQLCDREAGEQTLSPAGAGAASTTTAASEESLTNTRASSPKGSALLAWAIYARIPLLCCQASSISEVNSYLGSYRPPPPPAAVVDDEDPTTEENRLKALMSKEKNEEADRVAAMLSQPQPQEQEPTPTRSADANNNNNNNNNSEFEDEVWAAESDPSDFEFDSGFSYEQQMTDFQDSFAEWMVDRSDPLKLSRPATAAALTWKQVRHAVMDLTSQLAYHKLQSLWTTPASNGNKNVNNTSVHEMNVLAGTSRGPSDLLAQFTMTLLIPPTTGTTSSVFDSPDDEEDALQPQRQLQAMAWYPLWVIRDASHQTHQLFSQYASLLQTLIAVDAASKNSTTSSAIASMAPATYVGLASLSALCQQFVRTDDNQSSQSASSSSERVEQFRALRLSIWEISDDLMHALEQEDVIRKAAMKEASNDSRKEEGATNNDKSGSDWIVWTLLPMFEILTNQRLLTGTTIMAKAESTAQRHHQQQASQRWAGLLQSGLFKQWLLRLQSLREESSTTVSSSSNDALWQLVRRSLLYIIAQSIPATSSLGKYAWRFPNFVSLVEIGPSYQYREGSPEADSSGTTNTLGILPETHVDDTLWNLLSVELAGGVSASTPTIQWKSKKSAGAAPKPLPSRAECEQISWDGFQRLCQQVKYVLEIAAREENKKENSTSSPGKRESEPGVNPADSQSHLEEHLLILRAFHRFIDTLVACPMLAKVFVHDLEAAAAAAVATTAVSSGEEEAKSGGRISRCLDSIQEALSQYKTPPSEDAKTSQKPKEKDEDAIDSTVTTSTEQQSLTGEVEPSLAKERSQNASLQENIHMIRKVLKVARSLLFSTPATVSSQNLASSASKTD